MYTKVLKAVKADLCQAEPDEILVPNPLVVSSQDNDHFIGIHSRKPARFGRVSVIESMDVRDVIKADQASILGAKEDDALDEERAEDVDFLLGCLSDFEPGVLLGCRYTLEDDEISWDIFEVDEESFQPVADL